MNIQDIAIQGDPQRCKDIIKFFEVMGVTNSRAQLSGGQPTSFYVTIKGRDGVLWMGAEPQASRTLVRLQPNSLLPEDWCVEEPSNAVLCYLNNKYGGNYTGCALRYYGETNSTKRASLDAFGLAITNAQFLALSGYKPEQKEQREEHSAEPKHHKLIGALRDYVFARKDMLRLLAELEARKGNPNIADVLYGKAEELEQVWREIGTTQLAIKQFED